MDLSTTDLANTYYQSYLRSYTYSDGTVNWLPVCAEVDGIIVNKTLLEKNGLPLPTNYEEFVNVCDALREKGIQPFASNFDADYTCMEMLQGLSIPQFTGQLGREWRLEYESGQTNRLSEEVWLPAFERMAEFIDYTDMAEYGYHESTDVFDDYMNGKIAMFRGTGEDAVRYGGEGRETVMLPYFGETEADNWYLTYPAFQIAASRNAEDSAARKALILDIMTAMLSEVGQKRISSSQNMVPYSQEISIDLSPAMQYLQPAIEGNRLYIRLASSDMFSISKTVVQGMLSGEYPDARSAFRAFNEELSVDREAESVAAHIDMGYAYDFDPNGGSKAASSVLNSVREDIGTDFLIAPCASVAGDVYAGDYTRSELRYITMGESPGILLCDMTGEQVYRYVEYVLTTPGKRGSVVNNSTLYVSSGFEMQVRKAENRYLLQSLTVNGEPMDREATYSVAVLGSVTLMLNDALEYAGVTESTRSEAVYEQIVMDRLMGGEQLAPPTNYITLE